MKKTFILMLFILGVFYFSNSYAQDNAPAKQADSPAKKEDCGCPPSLGKAPDFSLQDLNGSIVKLSDYEGKGVILFFWATWCPRCQEHIKELNAIYAMLKDKDIAFLSIDMGENAKKVARFTKKTPIDFPVLLDKNSNISQAYVVVGIPTFIVVDKGGYIKFQNHFWPHDYEKYICE